MLPVGQPVVLQARHRCRGDALVEPRQVDGVLARDAGRMPSSSASMPRSAGEAVAWVAEEDGLLAVAREAGLHEQLDVAAGVGAGHVEARGTAARAVAQEVLDHAVADVAGGTVVDRVELDDGPLVAVGVALDASQPGQPAALVIDVHLVVGLERAQGHAEEAEDRDVAGGHGQAQRADRPLRCSSAARRPGWLSDVDAGMGQA